MRKFYAHTKAHLVFLLNASYRIFRQQMKVDDYTVFRSSLSTVIITSAFSESISVAASFGFKRFKVFESAHAKLIALPRNRQTTVNISTFAAVDSKEGTLRHVIPSKIARAEKCAGECSMKTLLHSFYSVRQTSLIEADEEYVFISQTVRHLHRFAQKVHISVIQPV